MRAPKNKICGGVPSEWGIVGPEGVTLLKGAMRRGFIELNSGRNAMEWELRVFLPRI